MGPIRDPLPFGVTPEQAAEIERLATDGTGRLRRRIAEAVGLPVAIAGPLVRAARQRQNQSRYRAKAKAVRIEVRRPRQRPDDKRTWAEFLGAKPDDPPGDMEPREEIGAVYMAWLRAKRTR